MWDGAGGSSIVREERGFLDTTNAAYPFVELRPAEDGDSIYTLEGSLIGTINVVYPLMPSSDSHIEEVGTEVEDVMVSITQRGTTVKSGTRSADKFENKWPAMDPDSVVSNIGYDDPPGTGTGAWSITHGPNGDGGVNFEWLPGTPPDGRPPAGWAGYVKRGAGGGFDRVDPPIPTPEGQTWLGEWVYDYYPNGTILDEDSENYYKADGLGSYYAESKNTTPCDPADTLVNENATEPITYDAGCGEWEIGTLTYNVYADGNCSFYDVTVGSSYNAGVIGTCNGNTYSVDSSGTVTSEPIISGYEGEEAYITIPTGASVLSGTRVRPQYASGSVGEWTPWNYTTSGTLYGSDSSYNYYSDGAGSYTSEAISNPCDSSGYHYSNNGPYDLMYDAGCGSVQIGIYYENTYADGNCGTYMTTDKSSTPGDFTTCNGNIYTVDSTGNVTSRPECEDSNLHSGESGWSYDGCHWSYFNPCDSSGTDYGVDPYNSCQNIYADGNCGTYTSDNGSCPVCDSSGNYIGSGSEPTYYNSDCGPLQTGYIDYMEYADGTCGTYRNYSTMNTYYGGGTFIGECNGYYYYSDGSGGAYTA
jgi:hypothetical protein